MSSKILLVGFISLCFLLSISCIISDEKEYESILFDREVIVIDYSEIEIKDFNKEDYGFDENIVILETHLIQNNLKMDKGLVLWMKNVKKHPSNWGEGDVYTCPDETRGSYYSGDAYVSLIDTLKREKLKTATIPKQKILTAEGVIEKLDVDIPYRIRPGYAYPVSENSGKWKEVKPVIMDLKDYNGDGFLGEFVIFRADDCSRIDTCLIGINKQFDDVIVYPVELVFEGIKKPWIESWVDGLFVEKPISPGRWKYVRDYSARGGCIEEYTIVFKSEQKKFTGTYKNSCYQ